MKQCLRRIAEYLLLLVRAPGQIDDSTHKKHDSAPPNDAFEEAAAAARELKSLSNKQRLRLYGLYKQATVGDAPEAAPSTSVLDPAGTLKWRSWASLRGMARAAARDQYVHAVGCAAVGADGGDAMDGADEPADALDAAMGSMAERESASNPRPLHSSSVFLPAGCQLQCSEGRGFASRPVRAQ